MRILFVSATHFELSQFIEKLTEEPNNSGPVFHYKWNNLDIDLIITGLGTTFTTYFLTRALCQSHYDLVINAGIAGSFRDWIPIGSVVNVGQEQFSDFGIEADDQIKTVFEAGFADPEEFPFKNGRLINPNIFQNLEITTVQGITGNISHGTVESIAKIKNQFDPDIESMEGAAIFYVCLLEKVPFFEIRGISNYVTVRDTDKWDIPTAIKNLTEELFGFLGKFTSE